MNNSRPISGNDLMNLLDSIGIPIKGNKVTAVRIEANMHEPAKIQIDMLVTDLHAKKAEHILKGKTDTFVIYKNNHHEEKKQI